jgi:hypothetical protein
MPGPTAHLPEYMPAATAPLPEVPRFSGGNLPSGGINSRACFVRRRVTKCSVRQYDRARRESRGRHLARPHDVLHRNAAGHEAIGDDTAMAPPPHGLGAHDRAAMRARNGEQLLQAGAERIGLRVVGIVAEGQDTPEHIRRWRCTFAMMTPAAERDQMQITDARGGERVRQRVDVELWHRARARNRAHVHQEIDIDMPE